MWMCPFFGGEVTVQPAVRSYSLHFESAPKHRHETQNGKARENPLKEGYLQILNIYFVLSTINVIYLFLKTVL